MSESVAIQSSQSMRERVTTNTRYSIHLNILTPLIDHCLDQGATVLGPRADDGKGLPTQGHLGCTSTASINERLVPPQMKISTSSI